MGVCMSTESPDTAKSLHAEAERILKKSKKHEQTVAKVLMLGGGDSGKTTVLKQMRLITNTPFNSIEIESYRQLVFSNLISGMKLLVESLAEVGGSLEDDRNALRAYKFIENAPDVRQGEPYPRAYLAPLKYLWNHPQVQANLEQCRQYALPDNMTYFFPTIDRLFASDYRPTTQDIIHARARTVGIVETIFHIGDDHDFSPDKIQVSSTGGILRKQPSHAKLPASGYSNSSHYAPKTPTESAASDPRQQSSSSSRPSNSTSRPPHFNFRGGGTRDLHLIDVGGQKSERRKWIHQFQGVTAILFLVSLSGYDTTLCEERNTNQMLDAMTIWEGICSMEWFRYTSLILFLNKEDLFTEKVAHSPIRRFFPDYDGDKYDVHAGKEYFKRRFIRIAMKGPSSRKRSGYKQTSDERDRQRDGLTARQIYPHYVTATNTQLIRVVMGAVADIVLRENFNASKLL